MKKVIIVGPNVGLGGVERASANIANAFVELGVEVMYLALIPEAKFFELDKRIHYSEPGNFNERKMSLLKTLGYVRKKINKFSPDSILVFTKFYGALTNLALLGTKYKVFLSERSSPFYRWPLNINLFSKASFILRKPQGIIAQTTVAKKVFLKKHKGVPIEVIPNPLKTVTLYPEIPREKTILAVGRFGDSSKGFDRLVLAFAKCPLPNWTLCFAGGNKKNASFLNGLEVNESTRQRIKFLGPTENIDLEYAKAGIFAIPSRSEGFPNTLVEAMAAGLPCISFDFTAGPRDIISNGKNGLLVENGNIQALADTITFLANNPAERERLGKNALQIREKLKLEIIGQKYLKFIIKHSKI